MSTTFVRSFALCLVLVASGCASTYTADRVRGLSADRFGTLELANPVHSGILIAKIDGQRTSVRPPRFYQLAPGEHALSVRANVPFASSAAQMVYFDVAPGGRYRVEAMASTDAGEWGFGIVDAVSGQRMDRLWSNGVGVSAPAAR